MCFPCLIRLGVLHVFLTIVRVFSCWTLAIRKTKVRLEILFSKRSAAFSSFNSTSRKIDISSLNDDVLWHIAQHLDDLADRMAFASSCTRFRRICQNKSVMGKVDVGRYVAMRQQCAIKAFFQDKIMAKHITELNFNSSCVIWQKDISIEEVIVSCSNLQALHVMHCEMSIRSLHCILQQAHKLTTLSWSIMYFTPEDIQFMMQDVKSSNVICLQNIKTLCLHVLDSKQHFEIFKYLVLSCCKCLEELKICIWEPDLMLECQNIRNLFFQFKPSYSVVDVFQHFHSLTVLTSLDGTLVKPFFDFSDDFVSSEFSGFFREILRKKSCGTKWKKFWIAPSSDWQFLLDTSMISTLQSVLEVHSDDLDSVQAFSTYCLSKAFIRMSERIDDSSIRKLELQNVSFFDNRFLQPITRIGGDALQCLSLCNLRFDDTHFDANHIFNTLFSACSNIRELNLSGCHFKNNISKPLSKLRHLEKILLHVCAIVVSKYERQPNKDEANLLTMVENCQNVTVCDVYGCGMHLRSSLHDMFPIDDNDLLPIARWRKLQSLTCFAIFGIKTFNFVKEVSKNCKFLTMLRLSYVESFNESYLSFLESTKFLKDLVLDLPDVHLGSDFWKRFSCVSSLERLCIKNKNGGFLDAPAAVETIKKLTRLHVLHLHIRHCKHHLMDVGELALKMLGEEQSDRISYFELFLEAVPYCRKMKPINMSELCHQRSSIVKPCL